MAAPTYVIYYYYIKSKLNSLVLDVENNNPLPGAWISTFGQIDDSYGQLFFDDPITGTIRSKLNGFCLDIAADGRLVLNPYVAGKKDQLWERKGKAIVNRCDTAWVLDISEGHIVPRTKIQKYKVTGALQANQSWTYELV